MTLTKRLHATALILNNLKDGPAPYEDLVAHGKREFGISSAMIDEEANRLGVTAHKFQWRSKRDL